MEGGSAFTIIMILKHRDRELLRFEWVEPNGVRIVSVNETEHRFQTLDYRSGTVNPVNGESLALQSSLI